MSPSPQISCAFAARSATDISMDRVGHTVSEYETLLGMLTNKADLPQPAAQPMKVADPSASDFNELLEMLTGDTDAKEAPPSVIIQHDDNLQDSHADASSGDLRVSAVVGYRDLCFPEEEKCAPELVEASDVSSSEDERDVAFSRLADMFPSAMIESVTRAFEFGEGDFATAVEVLLAEEELEEATSATGQPGRRRRTQWVKAPSLLGNGAASPPRALGSATLQPGYCGTWQGSAWSRRGLVSSKVRYSPSKWPSADPGLARPQGQGPGPQPRASPSVWSGRHPSLHWWVDADRLDVVDPGAYGGGAMRRAGEKHLCSKPEPVAAEAFPALVRQPQGGARVPTASTRDKVFELQAAFPSFGADLIEDVLLANAEDADQAAAQLVAMADDAGTVASEDSNAHGDQGAVHAYSHGANMDYMEEAEPLLGGPTSMRLLGDQAVAPSEEQLRSMSWWRWDAGGDASSMSDGSRRGRKNKSKGENKGENKGGGGDFLSNHHGDDGSVKAGAGQGHHGDHHNNNERMDEPYGEASWTNGRQGEAESPRLVDSHPTPGFADGQPHGSAYSSGGDNTSDGGSSSASDAAIGFSEDDLSCPWEELDAAIAASLQDVEYATALQGGTGGRGGDVSWADKILDDDTQDAWRTVAPKRAVGGKGRGGADARVGGNAVGGRAPRGVAAKEAPVSARAAYEQRRLSDLHARARNTYFRLAQLAFAAGDGASARELSRQGHHHDRMMRGSDELACAKAFHYHNAGRDLRLSVDLHGLYVAEALPTLAVHLRDLRTLGYPIKLSIITGVGNRSQGGRPRLYPAVLAFLNENGYKPIADIPGVISVVVCK